jgi:hypothetical protein
MKKDDVSLASGLRFRPLRLTLRTMLMALVVVISFSGHGSTTHELVTHDADPDNLPSTSLPLDQLTDAFARERPARQLPAPAVRRPKQRRILRRTVEGRYSFLKSNKFVVKRGLFGGVLCGGWSLLKPGLLGLCATIELSTCPTCI